MVATRRPEVPAYLVLQPQEIPFDDPHSRFLFQKHFVATRAAYDAFGIEILIACLARVQHEAATQQGLDYLQIFRNLEKIQHGGRNLWFIEDGAVVTALLPEDY